MKDKIKKHETFIKYIVVAILSFLIDLGFFNIFNYLFKNNSYHIIIATTLARIISSFINYLLNKDKVFKSNEKTFNTIFKYYSLVVVQMLISALLVNTIYNKLTINVNFIKVPVEFLIFISNYIIQKVFIFKRGKNEK